MIFADIVHTVDTLDIVKSVNNVDNVSSVNSVHSVHNVQMAHPNMEDANVAHPNMEDANLAPLDKPDVVFQTKHYNKNVQTYRGGPFRAENQRKSTFGTGIRIPRAPGAQKKGSRAQNVPKNQKIGVGWWGCAL